MNTPDRNYNHAQIGYDFTHDGIGSNVPAWKITSPHAPALVLSCDGANACLTLQGATTLGIDASALGVADTVISFTATTDSVTAAPQTNAPNAYMKALIGSTAYYIGAYTLSGS